jgi:hypothetical protein
MEGVTLPKVLDGVENGKIPDDLLAPIVSGRSWRALKPAAPIFALFFAAVYAETGRTLSIIKGSGNAYRTFARQDEMFRERHRVCKGGPFRYLKKLWCRLVGMAASAIPGFSNHGWALACDLCWVVDGVDMPITALDRVRLRSIAARFGIYDTVRSENWHWVIRDLDVLTGVIDNPIIIEPAPAGRVDATSTADRPWLGGELNGQVTFAGHSLQSYVDLARWSIAVGSGLPVGSGEWSMVDVKAVVDFQAWFGYAEGKGIVDTHTWNLMAWALSEAAKR